MHRPSIIIAIIGLILIFASSLLRAEEACSDEKSGQLDEILQIAKDTDSCFGGKSTHSKNDNIADYCSCLYKKVSKGTIPKITSEELAQYTKSIQAENELKRQEKISQSLAGIAGDYSALFISRFLTKDYAHDNLHCNISKIEEESCSEKAKEQLHKLTNGTMDEFLDTIGYGIKERLKEAHKSDSYIDSIKQFGQRSTELVAQVLKNQKISAEDEQYFREIILTTHPEYSRYSFIINGKRVQSPFASEYASFPDYKVEIEKKDQIDVDKYYLTRSLRTDLGNRITNFRITSAVEKNCQQIAARLVNACNDIESGLTHISKTDLSFLRGYAAKKEIQLISEENASSDEQYKYYRDYVEGRMMCLLSSCMTNSILADKKAENLFTELLSTIPSLHAGADMRGSFSCSISTPIQTELPPTQTHSEKVNRNKAAESAKVLSKLVDQGRKARNIENGISAPTARTLVHDTGIISEADANSSEPITKNDDSKTIRPETVSQVSSGNIGPSFSPITSGQMNQESIEKVVPQQVEAKALSKATIEERLAAAEKKFANSFNEEPSSEKEDKISKAKRGTSIENKALREEIEALKKQLASIENTKTATGPNGLPSQKNKTKAAKTKTISTQEEYNEPDIEDRISDAAINARAKNANQGTTQMKNDSNAQEPSSAFNRQIAAKASVSLFLNASDANSAIYVSQDELKMSDKNFISDLFKRTDGAMIYTTETDQMGKEKIVIYEPVIDQQGNIIEYRIKVESAIESKLGPKKKEDKNAEQIQRKRLKVQELEQLLKNQALGQ